MSAHPERARRFIVVAGLVAIVGLLVAGRAWAHSFAPALLELDERPDGSTVVTWKTAVAQIPGVFLVPRLPAACVADAPHEQALRGTGVVERWTVRCGPGGLVGGEVGIDGLRDGRTDALLRVKLGDGRVVQAILRPDAPSFVVPASASRLDVLRDYARLGVAHIAGGPDHLLFVFGLVLLVPAPRRLLGTITAFTLGHSVTLSLAALGYARVPSAPVEVLIALSVFVLAVELAGPGDPSTTLLGRRPWLMAASFGLLHGLGFAGALREAGLPDGEIPSALLGFNFGIEVGQIALVLGIVALRRLLRPVLVRAPRWVGLAPVYGMGALAASWILERTIGGA